MTAALRPRYADHSKSSIWFSRFPWDSAIG